MQHAQLHQYFILAVEHIRERLGAEDIGAFQLELACSGRTMTDQSECKIEYRLAPSAYGGGTVVGNSLEAVIEEVIRRHHWEHRNAPLALPPARNEEII